MPKKIFYPNDRFVLDVQKISNYVKEIDFEPDYIVGIVRGGAIPAIYLSHYLNVPVKLIHISFRDSETNDFSELYSITAMAEQGKKILMIEDIVDSGKTMEEIKKRVSDTGKNILYTALWYNPSQSTTINFWCNVIDRSIDDSWIIFPWEH